MARLNRRQLKQFWQEFREFALRGNVIELAIAVVVGGAFGRMVTSLVEDLIMPLVNPLIPGGDWRDLTVGSGLRIGKFLGSFLDFGVIALSLFILLKLILPFLPKKPPAPEQRECPYCLEWVPLKATRCRACTAELPPL
ncbi:MAG: large-conductance mechanosensitive channel [Thermosynechococcus sp.]|uniref:large conductance mechanosensitive channel protein MscL n=1 Tax=Thermosynechococcus sp. TaxID=2814275 RepID=UPI0022055BC8|nr:large conductance mechanosensitive channel protein MscL [Thermosynechococcus sp.]BCX11525.1 MAG: large-conductance mechanosensitive channel [Thermosynechococcus sp.]